MAVGTTNEHFFTLTMAVGTTNEHSLMLTMAVGNTIFIGIGVGNAAAAHAGLDLAGIMWALVYTCANTSNKDEGLRS